MTLLSLAAGSALILIVAHDVWRTLFRPSGRGHLSRLLDRGVWRALRHLALRHPSVRPVAGPAAYLAIVGSWLALATIGWALVYLPFLPGAFLLMSGLRPSEQGSIVDALYISLVTLTTLGYGDIAPQVGWLRVLAPIEALVGFALATAAISWLLSIYPVLARRNGLAHQLTLLGEADPADDVAWLRDDPRAAAHLMERLVEQVIAVRGDFLQFPVTYYFVSTDERSTLARGLPVAVRLADAVGHPSCPPALHARAAMLRRALEDLGAVLDADFLDLGGPPLDEVLAAYADDVLGPTAPGRHWHKRPVEAASLDTSHRAPR